MTHALVEFMGWVHQQGAWGWLWLVLCYALACVTFLPGSVLTLGAGVIYGLWMGTALISAGSLLGSGISFLASRYLFRDWLEARMSKNPKFHRLDAAVEKGGWKIVLLSRLSPIFPFSLLNYGLGLTRIPLWQFLAASWLGTLPLISVYVYGGMVAGNLAALGKTGEVRPPGVWALQIVGLAATILLCIWVTRIATRALKGEIDGPEIKTAS